MIYIHAFEIFEIMCIFGQTAEKLQKGSYVYLLLSTVLIIGSVRLAWQSPKKGSSAHRVISEQKVLEQSAKKRVERATKELNITVSINLFKLMTDP